MGTAAFVNNTAQKCVSPVFLRFGFRLSSRDRKSTRLNSSHSQISYAVFCLKKHTLKDIGVQYDNDDPAKAASIVSATLSKNPDLKRIFATNLFSAEVAATALRQRVLLGKSR